MEEGEREAFLARFALDAETGERVKGTLVGFCVLGDFQRGN